MTKAPRFSSGILRVVALIVVLGVVICGPPSILASTSHVPRQAPTLGDAIGMVNPESNLFLGIIESNMHDNACGFISTSDSNIGTTIYNNKGVNLMNRVTTVVK